MNVTAVHSPTVVSLPTAMGTFHAVLTDAGVASLRFPDERRATAEPLARNLVAAPAAGAGPLAVRLAEELDAYLRGDLTEFSLPVDLVAGTPFQQDVWRHLGSIRYGEVRSYADVARAIGRPSAVRAVGAANGANPVPIIVPCHRVIGSTGKLTGFGAGIGWKLRLLAMENPDRWGGLPLDA